MKKKLVVVVEDDREIRDVLTELFEGEGYAVTAVWDGPSVVQRIQEVNDAVSPITLITLDLTLPNAEGASILRELKAHPSLKRVPVVVITANMPILCPETRPLAAAVIRKPFDLLHLLDTVSGIVGPPMPYMHLPPTAALATRFIRP